METKKDIGTALKERLESFNDSPDDLAWMQIESGLLKKKKKRRFIFWLFGIGFGMILFSFFMFNSMNTSEIQDHNTIEKEAIYQTIDSETDKREDLMSSDKNNLSIDYKQGNLAKFL